MFVAKQQVLLLYFDWRSFDVNPNYWVRAKWEGNISRVCLVSLLSQSVWCREKWLWPLIFVCDFLVFDVHAKLCWWLLPQAVPGEMVLHWDAENICQNGFAFLLHTVILLACDTCKTTKYIFAFRTAIRILTQYAFSKENVTFINLMLQLGASCKQSTMNGF